MCQACRFADIVHGSSMRQQGIARRHDFVAQRKAAEA
jgi:hypothetical protein